MKRIRNKLYPEIGKELFVFTKNKGTVNVIFTLNMILERSIEKCRDQYLCLIDYSKAFDLVKKDELFRKLFKV